jgi:orotate phosphoribosyltransferase
MHITGDMKIIKILQECGAFITGGHFVLKGTAHSGDYVDKDMASVNTRKLNEIAIAIAAKVFEKDIGIVIGPQAGGVVLAGLVVLQLATALKQNVMNIYAEKADGGFKIGRPAHLDVLRQNIRNILVVEDILTTGGSASRVIAAYNAAMAGVFDLADIPRPTPEPQVHVAAIVNRGGVTVADISGAASLEFLVAVNGIEDWPASDCPLCAASVPINIDRGHGKDFLAQQKAMEAACFGKKPSQ